MSATVGELVVNLVARTAAFKRGLQQSQQQVAQFSSRVQGMASGVAAAATRFLPMIGAAFSVRKVLGEMTETLDNLSTLGKESSKLGMLPEELTALRIAAEQAGRNVATMQAAIGKFQARLAEAAITGKGMSATLREIGLSASELEAGGPAQAMAAIAEHLERIDNVGHRARITLELFGKSGLEVAASLQKLKESQENAKSWDLGNPAAVMAGTTYENIKDQIGYALQSQIEHNVTGWAQGITVGRGFLQGGPEGARKAWNQWYQDIRDFKDNISRQQRDAAAVEREISIAASRASGQDLLGNMQTAWDVRGLSDWQKRIALWGREAEAVGMARAEILAYALAMAKLGQAQDVWEVHKKELADRASHAAKLIRGQLTAHGEGAQLAPLATMGSLAAYQAIAHHGLQGPRPGPTKRSSRSPASSSSRKSDSTTRSPNWSGSSRARRRSRSGDAPIGAGL